MTAIIFENGKILFSIQANSEIVALNTPENCIAVEDPPNSNMFYQDGWVDMPPQPCSNHIFDYDLKQWVDPRTIKQFKEQHWQKIKAERDSLEFGGFEYKGNIYDSDLTSQSRIIGASIAGLPQTWTLKDNSMVDLSAQQLNEMYASLQTHIAQSHERGRIARQLIHEAETKDQVEAINL